MLVVMKHFHYTQERISTRINRAQAWGPTVWGDCARIKISLNMLKFVTATVQAGMTANKYADLSLHYTLPMLKEMLHFNARLLVKCFQLQIFNTGLTG